MKTVDELWMDFDEQNLALHNALDMLYAMSEAAKSDDLDHKAFANALTVLYDHLSEIETQYSQLNETLIALKT